MNLLSQLRLRFFHVKGRGRILGFSNCSRVYAGRGSQLVNDGMLMFGHRLPSSVATPARNPSVLKMSAGGKIVIRGDVFIAPGCHIAVGEGATLEFGGDNFLDRDCTVVANNHMMIGRGTKVSWSCNFIDDDGHQFYRADGKPLRKIRRKMWIGENVGIQMHVSIPRGVSVGDNSVVSSHTCLRSDVPPNSLIYEDRKLVVKSGISSGFREKEKLR